MTATQATLAAPETVGGWRTVVADYVALTKPKVQSLLLLTTVCTMEVAGDPSLEISPKQFMRNQGMPGEIRCEACGKPIKDRGRATRITRH